ncbi:hypothetical protein [Streptomyces sp. NPDC053755]|uniref:hypothetical protein n=1 Tax=Streptomyces sp. NPDC053755 TaxID=3155815 RepID=UPI0034227FDC
MSRRLTLPVPVCGSPRADPLVAPVPVRTDVLGQGTSARVSESRRAARGDRDATLLVGHGMQPYDISHRPVISAPADRPARPSRNDAEAALVEHYPRLVRLAHTVLPPALGRHRRVLTAHSLVQRALSGADRSRRGPARPGPALPAQRGHDDPALAWLRERVVAGALRTAARPSRLRVRPLLPVVLGLRLFPRAGGDGELALERELGIVAPQIRAAFALRVLEGLTPGSTARLLTAAGVADARAALQDAERLAATAGTDAESLLHGAEFDACTVQTRPTDLLRRRQRRLLVVLAAALLLTAAATATVTLRPERETRETTAPASLALAVDPARLVRAPGQLWADTARVDLTVWPARGARTGDTALLSRALDAWARATLPPTADERAGLRVTLTPGAAPAPPIAPAQLLFAGTVDDTAVVLLYDRRRLVRYAEPLTGRGPAAVELALADDTDVTTGAAVVVGRDADRARFLLAPWIDRSAVRDLRRPSRDGAPLAVSPHGLTDPVPRMAGDCGRAPVLELRSSARIVEDHSFLLADLGDLTPAHLSWTPPPTTGTLARQPREATSAAGLAAWGRSACSLTALGGTGVRAVNRWEFAEHPLPGGVGRATWTCTRAEDGEGRARVSVAVEATSGTTRPVPGPVPEPTDTAACSRFGQHVLAGTYWTAPSGARHYLAAGSRRLTGVTARGAVSASVRGPLLAVRTTAEGPVRLTGTVPGAGEVRGWGEGGLG